MYFIVLVFAALSSPDSWFDIPVAMSNKTLQSISETWRIQPFIDKSFSALPGPKISSILHSLLSDMDSNKHLLRYSPSSHSLQSGRLPESLVSRGLPWPGPSHSLDVVN